jgi:hypothetical protein
MLADDRATHPMTFASHLGFTGQIDRGAFRRAVSEALALHPLLSARVVDLGPLGLCWDWSDPTGPRVDFVNDSTSMRYDDGEQIDLSTHAGSASGSDKAHDNVKSDSNSTMLVPTDWVPIASSKICSVRTTT